MRDGTFRQDRHGALLRAQFGDPESILNRVGQPPRRRLLAGERVLERTDGPWLRAFAFELCKQNIGRWSGLPLEFYPEQQAFLDDALAFDDEGRRLYRTVVWGIPRKNGKSYSCGTSALALCSPAEGEGKPQIVMAAGSKEQADPMYDAATDFINADTVLTTTYVAQRTAIACPWNDGYIKRVAGDGKLNHGLNPYMVMADELHAWVTPKQKENWAALTTAFGARDDAQLWIISTAGWDVETILGELYRRAWESEFKEMRPAMGGGGFVVKDQSARLLVHWYAIAPGTPFGDLEEWKRANPAPWRTQTRIGEDLASKDANESEKRRLYGNQWTTVRDRWIPAETWEASKDETVEIPDGAPIFVGVDAALTRDMTAVAWAYQREDGKMIVRCRIWSARRDAPAHVTFSDGRIDNDEAATFIREKLASRYQVVSLAYDERFFEDQAKRLSDVGFLVVAMPPSAEQSRRAWDTFHRLAVTDQAVVHDGDRVLTAHVSAAAGTLTDRGWRVSKMKQTNPIDGLAAVVLAAFFASQAEGSVYDGNELVVL